MIKKTCFLFILGLSFFLLTSCDNDEDIESTRQDDVPTCELGEVFIDGECVVPSPEQIDYATENALTFELTGYDLEYHYFTIQLQQIDGYGGTYKLEYYRIDEDSSYYEEGLYTTNVGYDLERDDHPNGQRPVWTFKSSGSGIYLHSIVHYETTDDGSVGVYDTFQPMTFEFVID
jgi:hypothetical protein